MHFIPLQSIVCVSYHCRNKMGIQLVNCLAETNGWVPVLVAKCQVVNLSITHDYLVPFLSFNVSRSSGNSNPNLASVTSNFRLGLHQFDGTAAQSWRFLPNMIL